MCKHTHLLSLIIYVMLGLRLKSPCRQGSNILKTFKSLSFLSLKKGLPPLICL